MENRRRGWRRVWIATFGFWAVNWLVVGLWGWQWQDAAASDFVRYSEAGNAYMAGLMLEQSKSAGRAIELAMGFGIFGTLYGLVVLAIGYWVARGFRPQ